MNPLKRLQCLPASWLKIVIFTGNIYRWLLFTFSLLMPWVLLMSVQATQSLKDNQQAWQFRLWAYCGIFGEWRCLCIEYCGFSCCTNCCVKLNYCTPTKFWLEENILSNTVLCNAFFCCFRLWSNLFLINDHYFLPVKAVM